jgi:hypothetical protein
VFARHRGALTCLALSPDGCAVATGERALDPPRSEAEGLRVAERVEQALEQAAGAQREHAPAPAVWVWGLASDGRAESKIELNAPRPGAPPSRLRPARSR